MMDFGSTLCSQTLRIVSRKYKKSHKFRTANDELTKLTKELNVDDIILIDGTEVNVRKGCLFNFQCKGKGRKHKDGTPTKPGLKLHVALSLIKQNIEYINITQACDSERAEVEPEFIIALS